MYNKLLLDTSYNFELMALNVKIVILFLLNFVDQNQV